MSNKNLSNTVDTKTTTVETPKQNIRDYVKVRASPQFEAVVSTFSNSVSYLAAFRKPTSTRKVSETTQEPRKSGQRPASDISSPPPPPPPPRSIRTSRENLSPQRLSYQPSPLPPRQRKPPTFNEMSNKNLSNTVDTKTTTVETPKQNIRDYVKVRASPQFEAVVSTFSNSVSYLAAFRKPTSTRKVSETTQGGESVGNQEYHEQDGDDRARDQILPWQLEPASTAHINKNKNNDLDEANKNLKKVLNHFHACAAIHINELEEKEKQILDRFSQLDEKKLKMTTAHGNVDVSVDEVLEINAGGKIIAVTRATLTQLPGTRLEALFSGRWEKKLGRDSSGRIFLDVNSDCFQAIVNYMNELAISSADDSPEPPFVDDELRHILAHQMDLFGLIVNPPLPDSNIIKQNSDAKILHNWLEEDGSGGELKLLYRASRDGLSSENFHFNCDNKGPTVVIIETDDGGVFGGYTNTAWKSSGAYATANKAFLFVFFLSGSGLSSPCKMKLLHGAHYAIYDDSNYGPIFAGGLGLQDLHVRGSSVTVNIGQAYGRGQLNGGNGHFPIEYPIEEMEVFQVTNNPTPPRDPKKKKHPLASTSETKVAPVNRFSKEVNDAINEKWNILRKLEAELLSLEESFKDEERFIQSFESGDTNDIVVLNVSGTLMATSRATLMQCEDSLLAQLFADTKRTDQGSASARVEDWTPNDVTKWVESVKGVPNDIATLFSNAKVNGLELLALNEKGLEMIGVERVGTICLLMKEIKQLEKASQDTAKLIEYSPYCFDKILDYLRLKRLHTLGLIEEPTLPTVCDSQKKSFEKAVKYYFPGESSKFILG